MVKENDFHKCPACGHSLHVDNFYKVNSRKSGRSTYCIECTKEKRKQQAKTEKDKARTKKYSKKYYAEHKEEIKELSAAWKRENREKFNAYQNKRNAAKRANAAGMPMQKEKKK